MSVIVRSGGGTSSSDSSQHNVKTSNARGDGTTDDTAAISAAMDAANASGKTLFFPPGDYVCGTISKSYAPKISGNPGTVNIVAANTSSWTWSFTGSLGASVSLTANVARNSFALSVASTASLVAGDLILIGDNQASYASQTTRRRGQIAQIASIDSGATLTLIESTYADFATASSAFIAKVTAPRGARISGLRFVNTNSVSTGGFVRGIYLRDTAIDIDGEGSGAAGVRLEHCYDFRVRTTARNYLDSPAAFQFGYGVEIAGACAHGDVTVYATRTRHAFTATGLDSTNGEPIDIRVSGIAHGTSAQAWDAHAQGSDITFADCQAFGAKGYGFALRGRRQHIQGGVVQGGYGGVWLFEAPVDNRISGLRVSDVLASDALDLGGTGGRGIRVQPAISGLTITGCELVNVARDGIALDSTGADVAIIDNVFRNVGQAGSGGGRSAVHAVGALTRARIVGNVVADNQGTKTTTAAVTLDAASTETVLRDNDVQTGIPALTGTGASSAITHTTYNAKTDYSAVGNGSTNDATAIQNALTAASAAGGGVVYLPPGTYMVAKYLLIPSNVTLMGAGMGVTTIKAASTLRSAGGAAPDGGGYSVLQATGGTRQNIGIVDLTVDGNESADRTGLAAAGNRVDSYLIDMRTVTGLRIERVATRNTWTYNIMVKDCSIFLVRGCDVQSPNTTGVYDQLDGIHVLGSNRGRVVHNYVDNGLGADGDDALVAHVITGGLACFDIVYAHNVCRGGANGNGIQLAGDAQVIRDIVVANNVFWGCRAGIFTNWYAASGNQPIRSVTITGNTVRDCTTLHAIWVHTAADGKWEDLTIANNVVDGYGNATDQFSFGICVESGSGSRGITITGNTLRNGYSRGVYFSEGAPLVRDYVLANNIVDMTAAQLAPLAVILGSSLDGVVSGNIITGRGTADGTGIYMNSTVAATATNQILMGNRVRAFATGVQITNSAGNNPTNTQFIGNNTQGNGTGTSFGTATVTSANNL